MFQALVTVELPLSRRIAKGLPLDWMAGSLARATVSTGSNDLYSAHLNAADNAAAPPGVWLK